MILDAIVWRLVSLFVLAVVFAFVCALDMVVDVEYVSWSWMVRLWL